MQETALPIGREVQGVCDLLGLDPLAIAKGGKVVIFCRAVAANRVMAEWGG